MTFFTNSKKYAKKIKKAEKCVVYENTVRELFSCEQFKKGAEAKGHQVNMVQSLRRLYEKWRYLPGSYFQFVHMCKEIFPKDFIRHQ